MQIQQLETFLCVAENLSFARAAEILNITQSAVSRQIHSLEEELGAKLLNRTTRTVTLTPAGLWFREDAKHILTRWRLATSRIRHHTASQIRTLSVGCVGEAYFDLAQRSLDACRRQIPAFHPFLRVLSHPSLLTLFYQGEIELLFGFRDDVPLRDEMAFRELCRPQLCCVLPAEHPLADRSFIRRQELSGENLITCPSYAVPVKAVELQNKLSLHLSPESIQICENYQAIRTLIRAGYGYSILPQVSEEDPSVRYIPLQDTEPLPYGIFYKKGRKSPLLREVISAVLSVTP